MNKNYLKKYIPIIMLLTISIVPAHATMSCQCVAFRMDDVQNYWIDVPQLTIMKLFHQKNASLTIGIIGGKFGNDTMLVNFIKNNLHNKYAQLEIANHGWLHENFTYFSKQQQTELMAKTDKKINKIFGMNTNVFIPPYEKLNDDTISAMRINHLKFLSSNTDDDYPLHLVNYNGIVNIPSTTQTGNLIDDDRIWNHHDHTYTFVQIMEGIQKYGYATVVIHPQEYAIRNELTYYNEVDKIQVKELGLLIDEIKHSGLKIVPLSQIPDDMDKAPIHLSWLDNVFMYFEDGKISHSQVYSSIKYLLEKKIIDFNLKLTQQ